MKAAVKLDFIYLKDLHVYAREDKVLKPFMNLLHLARDVSRQNQLHLEFILFCFEIPFKFQPQHDVPQLTGINI